MVESVGVYGGGIGVYNVLIIAPIDTYGTETLRVVDDDGHIEFHMIQSWLRIGYKFGKRVPVDVPVIYNLALIISYRIAINITDKELETMFDIMNQTDMYFDFDWKARNRWRLIEDMY